jgi:hypothetical protein
LHYSGNIKYFDTPHTIGISSDGLSNGMGLIKDTGIPTGDILNKYWKTTK